MYHTAGCFSVINDNALDDTLNSRLRIELQISEKDSRMHTRASNTVITLAFIDSNDIGYI